MRRARSAEQLDRAMGMFWERGYYDTSVDQLVTRAGLHRAAVYGEFGSKRRLFEACLGRYREKVIAGFFAPLASPDTGLDDIERFFRSIHDAAVRPQRRDGCLMVNTASEVSPRIGSVARIVSSFADDLRALFRRALTNARKRGDVRAGTDVVKVADYLLGAVFGLWALARSPAPARALRHYVDGVLGFVDGLRPTAARRPTVPQRRRSPGRPVDRPVTLGVR
jgi:TetR/AcrR family transcriptional repressor of nem operon